MTVSGGCGFYDGGVVAWCKGYGLKSGKGLKVGLTLLRQDKRLRLVVGDLLDAVLVKK